MSTYVISDLHGCLEEFEQMLEKIEFSEYDELYIDGDVCDRGKYPMDLLRLIMAHDNMHLIFGNHDMWLAQYTADLIQGKKDPGHLFFMNMDFQNWMHNNGGLITADQFMDLDYPVCYDIQNYLENKKLYQELTLRGQKFLIVHAGLGSYCKAGIRISDIPENELIWSHIGIDDNPFEDVTMIVGHMPTFLYGRQYAGQIVHGKNLLHIDCGCVFGQTLGCLRLDDMKEFYIKSTYPSVI
ncbi:MAG: fructose-bisphosphatase class III [Solobacterium sp.]|nr:fructose-bisphosphatase class III [Solobacterium sp.]